MQKNTSPEDHLKQVLSAFSKSDDKRLVEILQCAIKHLHEFAQEIELTHSEWFAGIDFLTATGQMCDEVRQEFVLLSDVLGVSMLLEMINYKASEMATEPTVLGPFHIGDSPHRKNGESVVDYPNELGKPLVISGLVRSSNGSPIAGAKLDVWQVQANALYDIQQDGDKRNMRGIYTTDELGRFEIRTIRPVDYTIPDDGPVGKMLRSAGREKWRPAHVHANVFAEGYIPVTTHLFDGVSPYLGNDAVFGVRESLIVDMKNGKCKFDFVLDPA